MRKIFLMEKIQKLVQTSDHGTSLMHFLRTEFNMNVRRACQSIQTQTVSVIGSLAAKGFVTDPLFKLTAGDTVQVHMDTSKGIFSLPKMAILYKDDHLLALRKSSGVALLGGTKMGVTLEGCLHGKFLGLIVMQTLDLRRMSRPSWCIGLIRIHLGFYYLPGLERCQCCFINTFRSQKNT